MSKPATIDDVIVEIDRIVADEAARGGRVGLFAALYGQVTRRVRAGIAAGAFEDGPRMERLDVTFASRYLDALATWRAGGAPSRCWAHAFEATKRRDLLLIQHVLLGINAHINLDLGIASAATSPGAALGGLHVDFDRINAILGALVDDVKRVLAGFSPLLHLLDEVGGAVDDEVANFSVEIARDDAWKHAQLLAALPDGLRAPVIEVMDDKATFLARLVGEPGRALTLVLDAVHLRESGDVSAVIAALSAI